MTRLAFRPRLSIRVGSANCWGPQWSEICNARGGHAGGGCVCSTPVAKALADYWRYLKAVNYPLVRRDGTVYRPSELPA